mmetsp:Transcript_49448/g.110894  ORF Transcript_49448/g.110894 Transcript_49448/m.110894 type:complete len:791 (+) Transcript_49448:62-2434(+)
MDNDDGTDQESLHDHETRTASHISSGIHSAIDSLPSLPEELLEEPCWWNEAWCREDQVVLDLPIFDQCCESFKRLVLREIRMWEAAFYAVETWYDREKDKVITLESLPEEMLPPLKKEFIGQRFEEGETICHGADFDTNLIVVLNGTVEKRVANSARGGLCAVKRLMRGDVEGVTEFLGAGSAQRQCALQAVGGPARVRYVQQSSIQKLCQLESADGVLRYPHEAAYFESLMLQRDDALPHSAAKKLLTWFPGEEGALDYLKLKHQQMLEIDSALGMKSTERLPEGIEERYYLDGQVVVRKGVPGTCALMILRGEVEATVPEACRGNCVDTAGVATEEVDASSLDCWLGDGRRSAFSKALDAKALAALESRSSQDIETNSTDLKGPPAYLGSGATFGHLTLLGVPVVFTGDVVARGPVVVAVLHRHVLLMALHAEESLRLFQPVGIPHTDMIKYLSAPMPKKVEGGDRASHLGPAAGPPARRALPAEHQQSLAATYRAWMDGSCAGHAGADALQLVLLKAMRDEALLWKMIGGQPPRLLDAMVRVWEPRWLLPNQVVVADEETCDALFLCLHGSFVVSVVGAETARLQQGDVFGQAQLLSLNSWTRTVRVDPKFQGEAMVMVLTRAKLLEILAGHPGPREAVREVEGELREAKQADWRLLQKIPALRSQAGNKAFLAQLYQDCDVTFHCPGDFIAMQGDAGDSLMVVLAGTCRIEQPQTLFCVDLMRGEWAFQSNMLGSDDVRAHDLVAVSHVMMIVLHRHVLLKALNDFPQARETILCNEMPAVPEAAS